MRRAVRLQAGFTLVEMLIALVLAGLLAVVVFSGLHLGIRSWEAVTGRQQSSSDAYIAQHTLRRVLGAVRLEWVRDLDGVMQVAFYGRDEQMLFVAPLRPTEEPDKLFWVLLSAREEENGLKSLVLHHQEFTHNDQDTDGLAPDTRESLDWEFLFEEIRQVDQGIVIHKGPMEGFRIEYLRIEGDTEPVWENEWLGDATLPGLVRIRFSDAPYGDWPELLIMPRMNAYGVKELL